jgi:hypothetical protein
MVYAMDENSDNPLSTDGEPEKTALEPPRSWSPKSKADFPTVPPHIQQAVAQYEAELSEALARAGVTEEQMMKVKPGKIVLRPPKGWPAPARQDFSKLPAHMQRDIAEREAKVNSFFLDRKQAGLLSALRAIADRRRLAQALSEPAAEKRSDGLMGLGGVVTKGMNHERFDPTKLRLLLPKE